ncbi:S1C family serine protease [Roseateles sp. P5_D6]
MNSPGRRRLLALAAGLACIGTAAGAETLPELIARAKRSVVVVGSWGLMDNPRFGFKAAGFVVADGLHVLTNAHVVPTETPDRVDRSIAVKIWTPDAQWVMRSAKLISLDRAHDLALLQMDGPPAPALRLAAREAPEGTSIALIGFPIGNALGYDVHVTHRGIVSARTAIVPPAAAPSGLTERAVRQLRAGAFEVLQLDVLAFPGNSGGPVLDIETGEVIGVLQGGAIKGTREAALSAPTGISYAVLIRDAAPMLKYIDR